MGDGLMLIMLLLLLSILSRRPDATCMHSFDPTSSRSLELALRPQVEVLIPGGRRGSIGVGSGAARRRGCFYGPVDKRRGGRGGGVFPFKAAIKRVEMNEGIGLIWRSARSAFTPCVTTGLAGLAKK